MKLGGNSRQPFPIHCSSCGMHTSANSVRHHLRVPESLYKDGTDKGKLRSMSITCMNLLGVKYLCTFFVETLI